MLRAGTAGDAACYKDVTDAAMYRLTPPSDGAISHFRTVRSAGCSAHTYHHAPVAQGIEHRIPNPGVACSNHAGGTNKVSILTDIPSV